MKPLFITYLLLSAFILPLNAQTFPQTELWLRDTAAQVINLTTDSVPSANLPMLLIFVDRKFERDSVELNCK